MVEPTGAKRKLAVILGTDAEGYTRLMREAEVTRPSIRSRKASPVHCDAGTSFSTGCLQ